MRAHRCDYRAMPVDSQPLLSEPQALTCRGLDPFHEVLFRFDRTCAVDQGPDHLRLRNLAPSCPACEPCRSLLVEFYSDRRHGNTGILLRTVVRVRRAVGGDRSTFKARTVFCDANQQCPASSRRSVSVSPRAKISPLWPARSPTRPSASPPRAANI